MMKKSIALLLALVLCLCAVSVVTPTAVVTAADQNLLATSTYSYLADAEFLNSCTDSGKLLTNGKVRGDGSAAFNDIYGVAGTTVEIYGTGIQPVIEFVLKDSAFMNSVVFRGVRRNGNRYTNIVSIQTSTDGSSYTNISFTESSVVIAGAPQAAKGASKVDQYFDVTAKFKNTVQNVKYLRITLNAVDPNSGTKYVVSLDEIEAYSYSSGSYTPAADIKLSADRGAVRPGDYVTVTATVDNITTPNGIVSCDLPLTYDKSLLELVAVSELYPTAWGNYGIYAGDEDKTASPYWLRSVCDAPDLLTNKAYYLKDSGVLGFKITFKALAEGSAIVKIDNDAPNSIFGLVVDAVGFENYGIKGSSISVSVSNSADKVFTVSYDANGGSGAPAPQNKNGGMSLTLTADVPSRDGYIFKGWAISADSTTVSYAPGAAYSADESVVLYAVWEATTAIKGDVNGDGKVNSLDAAWILKYDAELMDLDETQLAVADVNGDGKVNSLDASKVLRLDAGLIPSL